MVDLHFYDVRGSLPKKGGLSYRKNFDKHVVAVSIVRAIELVMKAHPDATIYSVQHRGKINIAQEMPSDVNLLGTYYCASPKCLEHSGDGTLRRPEVERNEHGIWVCPNCHHYYGVTAFPTSMIMGA